MSILENRGKINCKNMKNYFKNIPYMQILGLLALVYLGVWGVRGTCNAPFFGTHVIVR